MQVQLNSDKHIVGSPDLHNTIEHILLTELKYLADDITRVEVHLNDENSIKHGSNDKRCQLEARIAGMQPISTEHRAPSFQLAVSGAAVQLAAAVKNVIGKAHTNHNSRATIRHMNQSSDDTGEQA